MTAAAACGKARESRARAPQPTVETFSDVAPRTPLVVDVPGYPPPSGPPSAPPPPDEDERSRRLPSSRVDGGAAPKPLPPGILMDAGPL